MTPEAWMNQYVGQQISGGQCVGWASYYSRNFLAVPVDIGNHNAGDIYDYAPDEYFWKIENTPDAIPEEGDIMCWGYSSYLPYGHIAVCSYTRDINSFVSYDQNWPIGSGVHTQWHDYGGVKGFLRAKNRPWLETPAPTPAPIVVTPVIIPPVIEPPKPVETPVTPVQNPAENTPEIPQTTLPTPEPIKTSPEAPKEVTVGFWTNVYNLLIKLIKEIFGKEI